MALSRGMECDVKLLAIACFLLFNCRRFIPRRPRTRREPRPKAPFGRLGNCSFLHFVFESQATSCYKIFIIVNIVIKFVNSAMKNKRWVSSLIQTFELKFVLILPMILQYFCQELLNSYCKNT